MTTHLVGASSSSHICIQSLSSSRAHFKDKQLSVELKDLKEYKSLVSSAIYIYIYIYIYITQKGVIETIIKQIC